MNVKTNDAKIFHWIGKLGNTKQTPEIDILLQQLL